MKLASLFLLFASASAITFAGPPADRDNTAQLLAQMGLTIPLKKMSEKEIQDMIAQTKTLK